MRAAVLAILVTLLPAMAGAQTASGGFPPQPLPTQPQVSATGGGTTICNLSLKATATSCDTVPHQVYAIQLANLQNNVENDLSIWALAVGSVTVGTTAVTKCIPIGPGSASNVIEPLGLSIATAVTMAVTTRTATNAPCTGTTAPTNGVDVTVDGK